jgi:hypothetical protein
MNFLIHFVNLFLWCHNDVLGECILVWVVNKLRDFILYYYTSRWPWFVVLLTLHT